MPNASRISTLNEIHQIHAQFCFVFRKETINMFWRPTNKKNDWIGGTQVTILELLPAQGNGAHRIRATMMPTGNKATCPVDAYEMHTIAPATSSALI